MLSRRLSNLAGLCSRGQFLLWQDVGASRAVRKATIEKQTLIGTGPETYRAMLERLVPIETYFGVCQAVLKKPNGASRAMLERPVPIETDSGTHCRMLEKPALIETDLGTCRAMLENGNPIEAELGTSSRPCSRGHFLLRRI